MAQTKLKGAFRVYRDSKGEWRWNLRASNGKVIADSAEGYKRQVDAVNGITAVRAYSRQAPLIIEHAPKAKADAKV